MTAYEKLAAHEKKRRITELVGATILIGIEVLLILMPYVTVLSNSTTRKIMIESSRGMPITMLLSPQSLIIIVLMAYTVYRWFRALRRIGALDEDCERLSSIIGLSGGEELKDLLDDMKCVNDNCFVNEKYVISFEKVEVYFIEDINFLETKNVRTRKNKTYNLIIKFNDRPNQRVIKYKSESKRNALYNEIRIAMRKYEHDMRTERYSVPAEIKSSGSGKMDELPVGAQMTENVTADDASMNGISMDDLS